MSWMGVLRLGCILTILSPQSTSQSRQRANLSPQRTDLSLKVRSLAPQGTRRKLSVGGRLEAIRVWKRSSFVTMPTTRISRSTTGSRCTCGQHSARGSIETRGYCHEACIKASCISEKQPNCAYAHLVRLSKTTNTVTTRPRAVYRPSQGAGVTASNLGNEHEFHCIRDPSVWVCKQPLS